LTGSHLKRWFGHMSNYIIKYWKVKGPIYDSES
jgi:hypothetical protein